MVASSGSGWSWLVLEGRITADESLFDLILQLRLIGTT